MQLSVVALWALGIVGLLLLLLGLWSLIAGRLPGVASLPGIPSASPITMPIPVVLILLGLAAMGGTGYLAVQQAPDSGAEPPHPTGSASRPSSSPSVQVTPIGGASPSVPSLQIKVAYCRIEGDPSVAGSVDIAFDIFSNQSTTMALGSGVYSQADDADHSTGAGDRDIQLSAGVTSGSRQVELPKSLPKGRYELTLEVWPLGKLGEGETIADALCGTFNRSR